MNVRRRKSKRKIRPSSDFFCREKMNFLDFRDVATLKKFTNLQGRIVSQKTSKLLAKNHRQVTKAIKIAREMALLPYKIEYRVVLKKEEQGESKKE